MDTEDYFSKGMRVKMNGQSKTIMQWARHLHISDVTIRSRIQRGFTVEEVLSTRPLPKHEDKTAKYEYRGESHSLYQWAIILDMKYITLYSRARKGWTGEKLFKKPTQTGDQRGYGEFEY